MCHVGHIDLKKNNKGGTDLRSPHTRYGPSAYYRLDLCALNVTFLHKVALTFRCDLENGVKVKYSAFPDFPIFRESNAILHSLLR